MRQGERSAAWARRLVGSMDLPEREGTAGSGEQEAGRWGAALPCGPRQVDALRTHTSSSCTRGSRLLSRRSPWCSCSTQLFDTASLISFRKTSCKRVSLRAEMRQAGGSSWHSSSYTGRTSTKGNLPSCGTRKHSHQGASAACAAHSASMRSRARALPSTHPAPTHVPL